MNLYTGTMTKAERGQPSKIMTHDGTRIGLRNSSAGDMAMLKFAEVESLPRGFR